MPGSKTSVKVARKSTVPHRRHSSTMTPRSARTAPAYTAVCRRHNPCELCMDDCPPHSRIGCRCNTSATARTCRCPQKLGKKFIADAMKMRLWSEQFKARAIHGQPGLLGENKQISRKDQFSSTYALAYLDPDSREFDQRSMDRPAGLETMRLTPGQLAFAQRSLGSLCGCQCCGEENSTPRLPGHEECAYCGFREGARDFRPRIRRSQKYRRSLHSMSTRTIRDAETSTDTGKSGVKITDDFLNKLGTMEEDLDKIHQHLRHEQNQVVSRREGKASTPKVHLLSSAGDASAELSSRPAGKKQSSSKKQREEERNRIEAYLIKKYRENDPGYLEYTKYAY